MHVRELLTLVASRDVFLGVVLHGWPEETCSYDLSGESLCPEVLTANAFVSLDEGFLGLGWT